MNNIHLSNAIGPAGQFNNYDDDNYTSYFSAIFLVLFRQHPNFAAPLTHPDVFHVFCSQTCSELAGREGIGTLHLVTIGSTVKFYK